MSTAAAYRQAPEQNDPRNGILDLFDAMISTLKDMGLESQVEAKLAKHFPTPKAEGQNVELALGMATVLRALQIVNPRNYSEGQRTLLRNAREVVTKEMARALCKEVA